jgi:predicted ATPase/class 3 adenylate cyclase
VVDVHWSIIDLSWTGIEAMAELPSGTVTFLLSDVEGSTALWEEAPEAMRVALARHDALFEAAVRDHRGVHIRPRGEGDSRFAVFSSATDAVAAALAIQRAFAIEPWPAPRPIQVRIGVHTGEAELREGDYYGSAVNRCARLRGIGHGGQTLLSEATAALSRDDLPADATLDDLGAHRLKDLTRPERVFQLLSPDLPVVHRPLVSLDTRPHNLPIQTTPLIGREEIGATIQALLLRNDVRLVTLTGPGGTGKTRLSLQVAAEILDRFEHGAFFVELAPISAPELVPATIAQVLEVRDVGGRPVLDSVKDYLRDRTLLLVLDNFEQLLSAAPVVGELLGASAGLKVLVTSRAPLGIRGEHEQPVPPLALPDPRRLPTLDALSQYAAVALFIERAMAIRPEFAVTNENAPAVAEICVRLDGLPLAIELAAARTRLLSPQVMLARLERRLPLLTGGARDLPVRQQTLRGAIAWSHDLLDEGERTLFRRLAIFVGGCPLEAAEAVCDVDGDLGIDPLDGVASLLAKSLLRQEVDAEGELRFGMLETIREYALERLDESGEAPVLRDRHLAYYLAFSEAAQAELQGPRQAAWFDQLERENDNLRAAMEWSSIGGDLGRGSNVPGTPAMSRVEAGIRLADAVEFFWVLRGRGRENLARVMALVALAPPGTAARARAVTVAAHVHGHMVGDYQAAAPLADEGLSTWRALGDAHGVAVALVRRGQIAFGMGDYQLAASLLIEARALFRGLGGESGPEVPTALWLAEVAQAQDDLERAQQLYDEVLAEARARGDGHAVAHALRELARLRRMQSDPDQPLTLLRESAALLVPLKDVRCAHICLEDFAGVLSEHNRPTDAARLFGAAAALRELVGKPLTRAQIMTHDRDVATVKHQLDPASFIAAWAEGRAMTLEQAVAYALDEQPSA